MLIRKTWDGQFVGKGDGGFYKIGGWGRGGGDDPSNEGVDTTLRL